MIIGIGIAVVPVEEELMEQKGKEIPASAQEYGLYNPETKTFSDERDLVDNQQRYDNNVQESEVVLGRQDDVEISERPLDASNFTKDFYQYSKSYQDNDNGAPGVDDDYGVYNRPAEAVVTEEAGEAPEEALVVAPDNNI